MKLNKTEQKLIDSVKHGRAYYHGERQWQAAVKLTEKGLCTMHPENGRYECRNRAGDYVSRYCPQGILKFATSCKV